MKNEKKLLHLSTLTFHWSVAMISFMKAGNVVEYIDQQKIMCAVILEVKNHRLRLLTETNREVNLSANRLSFQEDSALDLSIGRDKLVDNLKKIAGRRDTLTNHVDIKELWEVLHTEQEWIDLATMTEFCFPENPDHEHQSAVVRAFFKDRLYFKFNTDRFFPNSKEKVEQISFQLKEADRKNRIVEAGGNWVKKILKEQLKVPSNGGIPQDKVEIVEILKSYYLFEKECKEYTLAKAILSSAGIDKEGVFQFLVKLGVWSIDENIELYRNEIPINFSNEVTNRVNELVRSFSVNAMGNERRDLTGLSLITIDGQFTLDFDDALSIEDKGDYFLLGVHIADVGHFIKKGDCIDQEAILRSSSIYMPDQKIPMVPTGLAENLCSLKAGELRPAISTMVKLSPSAHVIDYEIFPSIVKVQRQLNYYDVNLIADEDPDIAILYDIAKKFRQKRIDNGAIHISLPEVNIWIEEDQRLTVTKTNRESPGRMLVAEIMIMANWLMAKFLAAHQTPAIFRTQAEPKERLFKNGEGTIFQNWMQRKQLSRFILNHEPEFHSGLGLEAYVTATSPIRKYFDLATQRQLRALLGLESPYSDHEIQRIIQLLEQSVATVLRTQYNRHRYWLLKYLESKIGQKEKAIVLIKMKKYYLVLLTEYMIECGLPLGAGIELKPEDLIQVTIQHVDARKDVLTVYAT